MFKRCGPFIHYFGGSQPKPTVTQTSSVPQVPQDIYQQHIADKLGQLGESLVPDKLPGFQPLISGDLQKPPSFNIPMSDQENALLGQAQSQIAGPHEGSDAARNYLMKSVNGDFLNPNTNPALQQQISALSGDTNEQLRRGVGDILGRTGAAGASGGSREALMLGQAAGDASRGYSSALGDLLGKTYGQERLLQSQTPGQLAATDNDPINRTLQQLNLAGVPREQAQQERNAQLGELDVQRQSQYQPLQVASSILGQRLGESIPIVSPTTSPMTGIAGLLGGLGGLAGGLGQAYGSFGGGSTTTSSGGGGGGGSSVGSTIMSMAPALMSLLAFL